MGNFVWQRFEEIEDLTAVAEIDVEPRRARGLQRLRSRTALAIALVTFITAACSQDPVGAYFDDASTITGTMRSEGVAATPRGNAITVEGVTAVNEVRRTALTSLEAIIPPTEVRPEHLALVTALREMVTGVDEFLATADTSDPAAFESAVLDAPALPALAQRVALACRALAERSVSLEQPTDIRC